MLEKLVNDPHSDVTREVAQNKTALKTFGADLLIHMMNRDFGVAFELADNMFLIEDVATRDSIIRFMQERGDPEILGKIAEYQRSLTNQDNYVIKINWKIYGSQF